MAESNQGKSKIANWERFTDSWTKKETTVDKKVKEDFAKSMAEMRKIMQLNMNETEKAEKVEALCKSMKDKKTFQHFPEIFRREFSDLLQDEKKSKTTEGTNKTKADPTPSQSTPKNNEEGNQRIDAGPVPKQSSHSPTQAKHIVGQNENKDAEDMKQTIKTLEKELVDEREKVKDQEHILKDREKQLKDLETDMKKKDEEAAYLAQRFEEENVKWNKAEKDLKLKQKMIEQLEVQLNEYVDQELAYKKTLAEMNAAYKKLEKDKSQVEKARQKDAEYFQDVMKDEKRKFDDQFSKLLADRDDLRDRFSKLAGAKLQEKNADIADLSDPNRAMKLSERFGQIYDDEWTNAFESLTDKKTALPLKDAISLLLRFLQDCWSFCNKLMTTQMESLNCVFLHPSQNLANLNPKQSVGGMNDRPRIGSKDDKALFALRRQIGVSPTVIEEVKQALLLEFKTLNKDKMGYEKKHVEACTPYLQKCAEICWLMALHDPPLHMKMDVKPGEKLNPNIYSVYSSSGNTIDFLVWPPLLNGIDGGLLAKGVAEPQRIVGKKK